MTTPPRRPGRPATVTAEQLADIALALWDAQGYAEVSLGVVAEAAGVNIRTVHRYFRAKSDIVWRELEGSFADLRVHLDATAPAESLLSRIRHGIVASIGASEGVHNARRRLSIISRTPELHTSISEPFIAWRTVIEDFAREQLEAEPEALAPRVLAAAAQSATMTALVWWAEHDDEGPTASVDLALRDLERGFAPR